MICLPRKKLKQIVINATGNTGRGGSNGTYPPYVFPMILRVVYMFIHKAEEKRRRSWYKTIDLICNNNMYVIWSSHMTQLYPVFDTIIEKYLDSTGVHIRRSRPFYIRAFGRLALWVTSGGLGSSPPTQGKVPGLWAESALGESSVGRRFTTRSRDVQRTELGDCWSALSPNIGMQVSTLLSPQQNGAHSRNAHFFFLIAQEPTTVSAQSNGFHMTMYEVNVDRRRASYKTGRWVFEL